MAVSNSQIVVGGTGATAIVAPAVTGASQTFSVTASAGVRQVYVNAGATGIFIGGNAATNTTGAAAGIPLTSGTLGPIPLYATEGLYAIGSASSTVTVLVTGT